MKEIIGINHIGIRVNNLESAREFYEKLGFQFIIGPIGPEPVAIMEHPSGVNINFILNADSGSTKNILMDMPERHPGYTHMALDVTDIVAIEETLNALEIKITEGPVTLPDGGIMLFIRDQDTNVIEFHQRGQLLQWQAVMTLVAYCTGSDGADFYLRRMAANYRLAFQLGVVCRGSVVLS